MSIASEQIPMDVVTEYEAGLSPRDSAVPLNGSKLLFCNLRLTGPWFRKSWLKAFVGDPRIPRILECGPCV